MPIWEIAFTPPDHFLESVVNRTCWSIGRDVTPVNYSVHKDPDSLQNYLVKNSRVFAGVVFRDYKHLKFTYELRFPYNLRTVGLRDTTVHTMTWRTGEIEDNALSITPRSNKSSIGGPAASYLADGFALMMNEITLNFVELKANLSTPIPRPIFQRLPHGQYLVDDFIETGDFYITFWIVISGFWTFSETIHCICMEKEKQIKEILKIVGLSNMKQWSALFIVSLTKAIITRSIILLMFTMRLGNVPAILSYCNPMVYFILQTAYSINLLTLALFISVIFKDPHSAVFFGRTIYFLLALPYFAAREWYHYLPTWVLMIMSLLGHSGYGLGVLVVYVHEKTRLGINFQNIAVPFGATHDFDLAIAICMMFLGAVIHVAALLYLEQVRPGKYGIAKKWYFLFSKLYCCKRKKVEEIETHNQESDFSFYETADRLEAAKPVKLFCESLTKKYGSRIVANNITLKLHASELVVLLGFNGAGKTVTLAMLAGILKPTSGTISLNGYDLLANPKLARKFLSYMPAENILFENLTVLQNMQFLFYLRGISKYRTEQQIRTFMKLLELTEYENVLSSKLTETQKRMLGIASALCGNSNIILIDAPDIGADPRERLRIWKFLNSQKAGKTILVTTEYINEAEKLADKIGILYDGYLQAFGTPAFIHKKYKRGNILVSCSFLYS